MKKVARVLILVLILSQFVACQMETDKMDISKQCNQVCTVDNVTALSSVLNNTYELEELQDYFGIIPPNERVAFGIIEGTEDFTICNVNQKFPIECMRYRGGISCYSVYQVKKGGYYYVFWTQPLSLLTDTEYAQNCDTSVYLTAYIEKQKNLHDFDSIQEGISTAEDIAQIDPAMELSFLLSSGVCSFSLLDDGSVLEVRYTHNTGKIATRKDLIVEGIRILSKSEAQTVSYIASISSEDLP